MHPTGAVYMPRPGSGKVPRPTGEFPGRASRRSGVVTCHIDPGVGCTTHGLGTETSSSGVTTGADTSKRESDIRWPPTTTPRVATR
jgi:hypothetical protein